MRETMQTKTVVTVAEMARMVGLSRARFYQLMQTGTFPPPLYDAQTHRPHFNEEMQLICLDVRRRNCGVNGKPVLFYARALRSTVEAKPPPKAKAKPINNHADLMDAKPF